MAPPCPIQPRLDYRQFPLPPLTGDPRDVDHKFQFSAPGYQSVTFRWSWRQLETMKAREIMLPVANLVGCWDRYPLFTTLAFASLSLLTLALVRRLTLTVKRQEHRELSLDPLLGSQLGGYRLVRQLGRGGGGRVYLRIRVLISRAPRRQKIPAPHLEDAPPKSEWP